MGQLLWLDEQEWDVDGLSPRLRGCSHPARAEPVPEARCDHVQLEEQRQEGLHPRSAVTRPRPVLVGWWRQRIAFALAFALAFSLAIALSLAFFNAAEAPSSRVSRPNS